MSDVDYYTSVCLCVPLPYPPAGPGRCLSGACSGGSSGGTSTAGVANRQLAGSHAMGPAKHTHVKTITPEPGQVAKCSPSLAIVRLAGNCSSRHILLSTDYCLLCIAPQGAEFCVMPDVCPNVQRAIMALCRCHLV